MRKKILKIVSPIIICILALTWFYWPKPLINDIENAAINIRIFVEYSESHKFINIENYSEEDVLTYLSTCSVRRCIIPDRHSVYLGKQDLDILIITGDVHTTILLADTNYVNKGGFFKYKILDAKIVTETLMNMIDYDSYSKELNSGLYK